VRIADEQGTPIRDEGSVTYSAALESASALDTAAEPLSLRPARLAGSYASLLLPSATPGRARGWAVWIWSIADEHVSGRHRRSSTAIMPSST